MSVYLSQGEQGGGPVSIYRKANTGAVFTYVCMCHAVTPRSQGENGMVFTYVCVPGFPIVMSSYLSKGEKGMVLTHACTRLCLWHVFLLIAKRKFLYILRRMTRGLTYVLTRLSASQQSCLPTYCKVVTCVSPGLPYQRWNKGVVFTYVCT